MSRRCASFVTWTFLLLLPGAVLAQEQKNVFVLEDREIEDGLERATAAERQGGIEQAGEQYAKLEALLEKKREKDPDARIVTRLAPGVDRSAALVVQDRVRALPEEGRAAYRVLVEPRARAAVDAALEANDADALEELSDRYALTQAAARALRSLGAVSLERGDLERAERAFGRLERLESKVEESRRWAYLRLCAAVGRRDAPAAADALASFVAKGGDAQAPRLPLEGRLASAREAVESLASSGGRARSSASVDPARLARAFPLEAPELPRDLAERLERVRGSVPAYQLPVWDEESGVLFVADAKTVRAIDPDGRGREWNKTWAGGGGEPARLEVAALSPAIGSGRVYATLHRNRPALRTKKNAPPQPNAPPPLPKKNQPKKPLGKIDDEDEVVRQVDWRVVALDARTGQFAWDAAALPPPQRFEDFARDAEWVSSPCAAFGQVFVTVTIRRGSDLRSYLVGLDGATGRVRFRAFLASRTPYDFLGLGAPASAPAVANGHVFVATGIGVVACVEPSRGEVAWVARYAVTPERSQADVVRSERRFDATPPLVALDARRGTSVGRTIVVAPVDAQEVIALDAGTGARRWSVPRGDAKVLAESPSGLVLVVGERVVGYDRTTGLARFRSEPLEGQVVAPPLAFEKDALVPLATALVRVSLEDGKRLARYRYEQPLLEAGAIARAGDGRVATASFARANVYDDVTLLAPAARGLERGTAALLVGESAAHRGDLALAVRELEKAATDNGVAREEQSRARRLAFAALAEEAARARAKGDRAGFLAACQRGLAHAAEVLREAEIAAGGGGLDAASSELSHRVATLRRAYADALADSKDAAELARAAEEYQRLLLAAPGTLVDFEGGLSIDARAYGRMRIRELVRTKGRAVYAMQDRSAAEHVRNALATNTKEGLERVARIYPASEKAPLALWELYRFYVARGLLSEAAAPLEQFVVEHPDHELVPEALARLALLAERTNRPARARRAAALLAEAALPSPLRAPSAKVRPADGAPERDALELAIEVLRRTSEGDADALARQDAAAFLEPPFRRVFRSTTELSALGGELLEPRNAALAPRDRYLLRRGELIESRSIDSGVVRARFDAGRGLVPERRWIGYCSGSFVVPAPDGLWAFDARTGAPRWTVAFQLPLGRPAIGPDEVHAVEYGSSVVLVLTKWHELHALDGATGQELWKRPLAGRDGLGSIHAQGNLAILVSDVPGSLEAIDLETGKTAWTWKPEVGVGAVARAGFARFVGSDAFAVVLDSRRLAVVERSDGSTRWVATAGGLGQFGIPLATPDGRWIVAKGMGGGPAFWVYDARSGKEKWHDDRYGAVLPGPRPEAEGPVPLLEEVIAGETAVYTFRQHGGQLELWAQELATGVRSWVWEAHGARGPNALVETPSSILIGRDGRFDRASIVVIGKGTGKTEEQIPLPGRKLIGRGIDAVGGVLVCSTDRGTFGLANVDDEQLARDTLDATLALARRESTQARAELAERLARAQPPRIEEAIDACSRALLSEGSSADAEQYDRLFAQLAALAETAVEIAPPRYDVRRTTRPPEIDGELNDWWRTWSSIELTAPRYVAPIQLEGGRPGRWNGAEDLSARLYMGWDDKYFYFVLDVLDSDLRPYDSESAKWIGDCLLIAIDCKNDGGFWFGQDDVLLSLALTLPKKKKDDEKKNEQDKKDQEEEQNKPEGKYFVKRKDDGSGAVYEAQVPWSLFHKNGATGVDLVKGPPPGFTFGFNVVLTDDDGDRIAASDLPRGVDPKLLPEGKREGDYRGALKTLQLTPSVLLHERKDRLWQGYVPEYFAKITVR